MRKFLCICMLLIAPSAFADIIGTNIKGAELVGKGRMSVFIIDAYDAALFAPYGHYKPGQPLALQLTYLRSFDGEDIAERSIDEMEHIGMNSQAKLDAWLKEMTRIFPDVKEGDTITGFYTPNGATTFYQHDRLIGTVKDPEFGRWFFDIWLSPNTSEPSLRKQLLGMK
ncbi:MAG: chalcone isomerase family protein [Rickettsiales bacterium]|nr:chalcone isomerase family protein [Rickettsiales bacterium]